jgi:hypothetical protein
MSPIGPSRQFAHTQLFVAFGAKRTLTSRAYRKPIHERMLELVAKCDIAQICGERSANKQPMFMCHPCDTDTPVRAGTE